MKIFLCIAIFVIGSHCQDIVSEQKENRIYRPCSTSNVDCIRRYFAEHAQCQVAHGPVPDPMYFSHTYAFLPAANMTLTSDDFYRTNTNGRIEEFYINKETDKLLIAVEFRNMSILSNNSYLAYHRRAKEPIINKTTLKIFIESMTITMIIPNPRDLQIQQAETTAYFNSLNNAFVLGPEAFKGSDPGLKQAGVDLYRYANQVFKEGMMTDGYENILAYIQHNICDFGIKI